LKTSRTIRRRTRLNKGEYFREGTRLLWLALQRRGWSIQEARVELELAEGALNKILCGDRRAGFKVAQVLQKRFRIPLDFELPEFLGAA
jgi:hypothetical protein